MNIAIINVKLHDHMDAIKNNSSAQQTLYKRGETTIENTLPPTPEAASAAKYTDVPVSHSRGLAFLDIPFHTLKGREISIPIHLSYTSGGIKMDETAGVAGLGWSLMAGGVVTRTVMDMPDEFASPRMTHKMPSENLLKKLEAQTSDNETNKYLYDIVQHRVDTSLDRYNYNVNGLCGTFVILDDKTVFHLCGDGVEVFPRFNSNGTIDSFNIVAPDGTAYRLAEKETSAHDGTSSQILTQTNGALDRWEATTAWHLTSVTSNSGLETATLRYTAPQKWIQNTRSRREVLTINKSGSHESKSTSPEYTFIARSHEAKVLSEITLSGYKAVFTYADDTGESNHYVLGGDSRKNFPFRLTGITIFYGNSELARLVVNTGREVHDGRIILNSLRLYNGDKLNDRWDFTYDTRNTQVSRYSQDWFGYYNGEDDASNHPRNGSGPFTVPVSTEVVTLTYGNPDAGKATYMTLLAADHDGAKTEFQYEGCSVASPLTGNNPSTIGLRVRKIKIYDNGRLVRVRSFSYENPLPNGPYYPSSSMYTTTGASISDPMAPGSIPVSSIDWRFLIHARPVVVGPSIMDTCVYYGKVTEDISAVDNSDENDNMPHPTARTIRIFSTEDLREEVTATLDRFPAKWKNTYTSSPLTPNTADPMSGVRNQYSDNGPAMAPLLTRQEEYSWNQGRGFSLISSTDFTYRASMGKRTVVTEYRATQVMQEITAGYIPFQDIYHYPVRTNSAPKRIPVSECHTRYADDNDSTVIDRYTLNTSYVYRTAISQPIRVSAVSLTEDELTRRVNYTYPDTWTGSEPWAATLRNRHMLSIVLRKDYRILDATDSGTVSPVDPETPVEPVEPIEPIKPIEPLGLIDASSDTTPYKSEITEFNTFLMPEHNIVTMPAIRKELTHGEESWREEVLSRDCVGNISEVKSTGKPRTVILWGWSGLYPIAVVENARLEDVTNSLGGQSSINTMTVMERPVIEWIDAVGALRTNGLFSQSLIRTFEYSPGIGVIKTMSPAGTAASYEYDGAGRLLSVLDTEGHKMFGYSYHLLNNGGNGKLSVRRRSYRDENENTCTEDVTWYNTLGMRLQEIAVGGAGDGRDLVTAYEGDFMLHDDIREWLPYPEAETGGNFRNGAAECSQSYHGSNAAFFKKEYEISSRDRLLSTALPGYAGLHEYTERLAVTGTVPRFLWKNDGIVLCGNYSSGELTDEVKTSPDGMSSHALKDHAGRIISTWRGNDDKAYYVYDMNDDLRAVVGGGIEISDTLNMWRYSYDNKGRLFTKGIPGCEAETYSYDDENRIHYRHRGEERTEYNYDSFGRLRQTTLKQTPTSQETIMELVMYDEYPQKATAIIQTVTGVSAAWPGPVKGLKTYVKNAEIDAQNNVSGYTETVWLYDNKERPLWEITKYSDGSLLKTNLFYDFSGNLLKENICVTVGAKRDELEYVNSYDSRERLQTRTVSLNEGSASSAKATIQYGYDDIGRPSGKSCHVNGGVTMSISDAYTMQQRLRVHETSISGQVLYSENLKYDDSPAYADIVPLYGGLIAGRIDTWSLHNGNVVSRAVGYSYDSAGRIVREHGPVENIAYTHDSRGNITRISGGLMADSVYTYSGDRLTSFAQAGETSAAFSYDNHGRMTSDGLKGTSFQYNAMDLVTKICSGASTLVNYSYLWNGVKICALKTSGDGLVYRGPFVYRKSSDGDVILESALFEDGRLTTSGVILHVTDHLGSVVAAVRGSDGALYEASQYDAFGKRSSLTEADTVPLPQGIVLRSGFSGKEDQKPEFGAEYMDFGARQYSSMQRRWMTPDPLSEKYYGISPYTYCDGDPVNFIDPDGCVRQIVTDEKNKVIVISAIFYAAYYYDDVYSGYKRYLMNTIERSCDYLNNQQKVYISPNGVRYNVRFSVHFKRANSNEPWAYKNKINANWVEIGEEKKNKEGNTIIGGVNKFDSYNRRTKKKIEVYNEISISKRHVSNDIVILHEMIHALGGLEHTDSGLMQEFLTADQDKTIYDSTIKEIIEKGKGRNK